MFRFFNTNDLISEIKKELDRAQYSTQIYIDEFDLYMLSSELLKALDNNLNIEIIIVSKSNKKTMRLVNLCKRLIDLDANIYWKVNSSINHINNYFAIFDKQYLISGFKEVYLLIDEVEWKNIWPLICTRTHTLEYKKIYIF